MPPRAACWVDANQYLHIPQAARRLLHLAKYERSTRASEKSKATSTALQQLRSQ